MNRLPDELLLHIFSYLPLSDLLQVQLVSRGWKEISRDNSIWRSRLQAEYLTLEISPFHLTPLLFTDYPREIYQIFYLKRKAPEEPSVYQLRVREIIGDLHYNPPLLVDLVRHFHLLKIERVPKSIKRNGHPKVHEYTFKSPKGNLYWSQRTTSSTLNIVQPGIDLLIKSVPDKGIDIGKIDRILKFIDTTDSLPELLSLLLQFFQNIGFREDYIQLGMEGDVPTIYLRIE